MIPNSACKFKYHPITANWLAKGKIQYFSDNALGQIYQLQKELVLLKNSGAILSVDKNAVPRDHHVMTIQRKFQSIIILHSAHDYRVTIT